MHDKTYCNKEIETISRVDFEEVQLNALKKQLTYVFDKSPFYKNKFTSAGVKPENLKVMNDLQRFPFTTKDDLRETQEKFGGLGGHL